MIVILSPSKTLNYSTPTNIRVGSDPIFINESAKLIKVLKRLRIKDLMTLMDISSNLAEINFNRYREWHYPFNRDNARPAFAAFNGDVYDGLKAWELDDDRVQFADRHVRILSGLYGLLKPTDLMLPYRLEMGIKLKARGFDDLYDFWGNKITRQIKKESKETGFKTLVNLASAEYAKVVDFKNTGMKVITPTFLEFRNGEYKFITLNGKKARGLMTRFIIDNSITNPEEMKLFTYEGYSFDDIQSNGDKWIFVR